MALVYAAIGVATILIAFAFRFTALGRADDYVRAAATTPDTANDRPVASGVTTAA